MGSQTKAPLLGSRGGGGGWVPIGGRDILPSEQNSERNIIKKEKIRGGGFFP